MKNARTIKRRELLKYSAGGLAAIASATGCGRAAKTTAPLIRADGQKPKPPSEKIVLGFIGTGSRGCWWLLDHIFLKGFGDQIEVAAVCDVDSRHLTDAGRQCMEHTGRRVATYKDFRHLLDRKDIDAVVIATPDHWHALVAIAAMEAGKDIYCEKPLSLDIAEGKEMVSVARRYGTVFQTGSQQRSDPRFRQACELVRNGKIGRVKRVDTVFPRRRYGGVPGIDAGIWRPATTPPPELDWDFWLGPAPYVDYHPNQAHYQFRWFYDYSGGVLTDWGAHHNDIAQWGLGTDGSGPVRVDGTKATFHPQGPHTVAGGFEIHYRYANDTELICHTQSYDDDISFDDGVKFTGDGGWVFVNRDEIQASDPELLKIKFGPRDVRLYHSDEHHQNWLDCIRTRRRCVCDVEIGHRSATVCHLGNISARLGRALQWDPEKEQFVGDEEANRMRCRPKRAPWHL